MKENLLLLIDLLEPYRTIFTKNVYMNKLDDIVNKYNNSYHPNKHFPFVLRTSFVFVFRRRLD